MAPDLLPVDVDVGHATLPERLAKLLRRFSFRQGLDRLVVENGVEDDRVIDMEDRGLTYQEGSRARGKLGVQPCQRRVQASWNIAPQEDEVAGPFVEARQRGRDVGQVGQQSEGENRTQKY